MRRLSTTALVTAAILGGGLALTGCATQEYVDESVAGVNTRIDSLSTQVDGRITTLEKRVDGVDATAQAAARLAQGKFQYAATGEPVTVLFATNSWKLSAEAQATLTAFAESVRSANRNVYLEIIGHGDRRGGTDRNRVLGEKRALEVRRFLFGQGIALNRMETASWGEEQPTGKDLKSDRRVDITVVG